MDRRSVLQSLAVLTVGGTIGWQGCSQTDEILAAGASQISFDEQSSAFMEQLARLILPYDREIYTMPETITEFVSTMVNDLSTPEDIQSYGEGYKTYKKYLSDTLSKEVSDMSDAEVVQMYEQLQRGESVPEGAKDFFERTRGLVLWQFRTSEQYMREVRGYSMTHESFDGCASINS